MTENQQADPRPRRAEVRFLSDQPAQADAFGPHSQVADAIMDTVLHQDGGRAIALEGGWGSGKSSVVEMLRTRASDLDGSPLTVVTFDAWVHRGDPLRRAFVTEVFRSFREGKAIGDDEAKTLQSTLAELEECQRQEPREVGGDGHGVARWFGALSLLLLPLGAALLAVDNAWCKVVAIAAVGAPLLVWLWMWSCYGLGRFASWLVIKDPRVLRGWIAKGGRLDRFAARQHAHPHDRLRPGSGGLEPVTREAIVTRDRTSIEFASAFEQIAGAALRDPARRLLIVIDNLDRLSPSEAFAVWRSMRLFVDLQQYGRDGAAREWGKRVWLLVPYDPDGLRAVLSIDDGGSEDSSAQDRNSGFVNSVADSFINKTFQIRFEAPPLLLTKWKGHLEALLREALPAFSSKTPDLHSVYAVAAAAWSEQQHSPTPRELRIFVNDIAAIVKSRGDADDVPLSDIALYVASRRKAGSGEAVRRELLKAGSVSSLFESVATDDSAINVARVLFVTPDQALAAELLLRSPLLHALSSGNDHDLRALAEGPAFWPAFELMVGRVGEPPFPSPEFPHRALAALEGAALADAPYATARELVRRLAKRLLKHRPDRLTREVGEGLAAGLKISSDADAARGVLKHLQTIDISGQEPPPSAAEIPDWADQHAAALAAVLHSAIEHCGLRPENLKQEIITAVECLPPIIGALATRLREKNVPASVLCLKDDKETLTSALTPTPQRSPWPHWRSEALRVAHGAGAPLNWNKIIAGFHETMQGRGAGTAASASAFLQTAQVICEARPDKREGLSTWLGTHGFGMDAVGLCAQEKADEEAAQWLALVMRNTDPAAAKVDVGAGSYGHRFFERIGLQPDESETAVAALASALSRLGEGSSALATLLANPEVNGKLTAALVSHWIRSGTIAGMLSPKAFTKRWEPIQQIAKLFKPADDSLGAWLRAVWVDPEYQAHFRSQDLASMAPLYSACLDAGIRDDAIFSALAEGTAKLSEDAWTSTVRAPNPLGRLVIRTAGLRESARLGVAARLALERVVDKAAAGSEPWSVDAREYAREIVRSLDATQMRICGRNLLDRFAQGRLEHFAAVVQVFEPAITSAIADARPGEFLRGAAEQIARSRVGGALLWLKRCFETRPELISGASTDERENLVAVLRGGGPADGQVGELVAALEQALVPTVVVNAPDSGANAVGGKLSPDGTRDV